MSPTHIWALELYRDGAWRFMCTFDTRSEARHYRLSKRWVKLRIRKYVPA